MIDIELLIFAKFLDLLNKKDNLKSDSNELDEDINEIRDTLKDSRFFKETGELGKKLNHKQAQLNNIDEKDQSNETMKKIITDYSFYNNKKNYDHYGNCIYETNNYEAVKSLNKNENSDDENTQLLLLLKYMINLKNIANSKLKMKDLNIELENLQNELNETRSTLTTELINGQQISLDESNNIIINWTKDSDD